LSDFYQHIKNKLADAPTHQPDYEVWDAVLAGIQRNKRWLPFPIWYLIPFSLLCMLAGGIGYYWGKSQVKIHIPVENAITADTSAVFNKPEVKTTLPDTLLIRDTIIQFVYLPANPTSSVTPPPLAQKQNDFSPTSNDIPRLSTTSHPDSLLFFINDKLYLQTKEGIALVPDKEEITPNTPRPTPLLWGP